jgi:hypothetical protein
LTQYHEPPELLGPQDRDIVRAWMSMKEEIEAVYWYHQRAAACSDPELRKILIHNRDEEIEHMAMALEWARRIMPEVDEVLRTYLFTSASVVEVEEQEEGQTEGAESGGSEGLGIGKLG